jgi:hypothetical protein
MTDPRDMTSDDQARLEMHRGSAALFRNLLASSPADGLAPLVAELSPSAWGLLRRLAELSFVDVCDGRVIVGFTISSLARLGYLG